MSHTAGPSLLVPATFALTLQWTDSERSRDSWSRTTTISVTADEVTYAEAIHGSIRRHAEPFQATLPLSDALRKTLVELVQAHDLTTDHTITGETGDPYSSLSV